MKTFKIIILVLIGITSTLFAQQQGSIRGKVIDKATKQPVVGANVTILSTIYGAATDMEGEYFIDGVKENVYKLEVSYIGYYSFIKIDVRVIRNKTTYVEEIELTETAVEGETITINGTAFREDKEAPVSNYSYSREEIRRSPGAAGDIFRAVEAFPGVTTSGGEFSAFSVRGAGPQNNIILVDNIPFDKVTHLEDGHVYESHGGRFSVFAPGIIEDAFFLAGGFPAQYGGKTASVLELNIKEGNVHNATINGYIDLLGWEANYNGPLYPLKNTGINLSIRNQDFGNVLSLTDQKDQGHPRFWDIILKTTTELNPENKISLLAIYAPENFDRTIDHIYESKDFLDTKLIHLNEKKSLLGLNWRILTGKNSFLQNTFYGIYSDGRANIGLAFTDSVNGQIPDKEFARQKKNILQENRKELTYGAKSEFTCKVSKSSSLISGIDIRYVNYDYYVSVNKPDTSYIFDRNDFRPNTQQKFIVIQPRKSAYNKQLKNLSAFIQFSKTFANNFVINPGIRFDYHDYNEKYYISPRLSLTYRLNLKTKLSAAAGIYYQNPPYRALAINESNRNLKNEQAVHYIVGLSHYLTDNLKINIETYYKSLDALIVDTDRTTMTATNNGYGWVRGLDFGLIRRFTNKFYGQISYSYSQSKRNDGNGYYNSNFNKPHYFNILGGYEFNNEWSVSAKWRYSSGRPKDAYIIHEDVHNDPDYLRYSKEITAKNADRLPAAHSLNIRVDYRKQLGRFAIISFIDILNVYSHLNVTDERFLEKSGENDPQGFEMLPTFGIRLEL